jgi:aminopeptidase YwaD
VDYLSWRRGSASLELIHPGREEIDTLSFTYSPSTEEEGLTSDLVFIPEPTTESFHDKADEIDGKVVLTYVGKGVGPACQSTYWANELGAESLILMANSYGSRPPAGSCRWNQPSPIPVTSVSREDGERLAGLIERNGRVTVRCKMDNRMADGRTFNVVGDVPGDGNPEEQVVIGCHYDGFDIAQSAIDNASGTAVLMDVARALSRGTHSQERTIRFVWFAAEELGMVGSHAYVDQHGSEMENVVAMMTTDWPGSPATCGVQRPFRGLSERLENTLRGHVSGVSMGLGMYSDHFPFMLAGVPAMWIGGSITGKDLEIYHTVFDTADKVPPKVFRDSSVLMALTALDLANAKEHPSRHRTEGEIRKFLEDEGRSEDLEIEGRW